MDWRSLVKRSTWSNVYTKKGISYFGRAELTLLSDACQSANWVNRANILQTPGITVDLALKQSARRSGIMEIN